MKILTLFAILLGLSACRSRKNTDYVLITTEARRLQSVLREEKIGVGKDTGKILKSISYDGNIRWEPSGDKDFLFRSVKKHSIKATSSEKSYYYIRKNGEIVIRSK